MREKTRNGAETTYTYDSLDRLLSVTYSDGSSVTYEYDALNNRTKETYSSRAGFPVEWIQNTNNVVSISKEIHQKISAYYSSIDPFISGNQTIRNWLNTQSFQSQYEFGIKVLEKFGVYVGK